MRSRLKIFAIILFVGWLAAAAARADGAMTQVHDLNFGSFGLHDNQSIHTLAISPAGTVTSDPAFIIGVPPQRGEFQITGLPASDTLSVTIGPSNTLSTIGPALPTFTVNTYRTNSPIVTNPAGEATLYVGASLQTSGAGSYYKTDDYDGNFELTINY